MCDCFVYIQLAKSDFKAKVFVWIHQANFDFKAKLSHTPASPVNPSVELFFLLARFRLLMMERKQRFIEYYKTGFFPIS